MKIHLKILFFTISSMMTVQVACADDDKYPKTVQERKIEEMGSILGGEGLTFSPSKIKNDSTKSGTYNVNKYLWQAAISVVNFAPLQSSDNAGGVIITDWYSPKGKPNYSFKINVFIRDNVISPDSIELKVFERTLKNGQWVQGDKTSDLAIALENKILRLARELYIQDSRK
jgi:hypothetical protein